jgi:Spy/CpxP family protein refolding chaperone
MGHNDMGHMDMMGGMMGMCIKNADKIGLSDEQKKKVTPLHNEMQKKQIRFQADLKIAQLEMKEIMEPKDFDIEKAIAMSKKTEELKTAYHLDMLKTMKEVRSIFTEEQYKKLKSMMPMNRMSVKPATGMNHKH